ncbi:MAG: DUF6111 family protein [Methylovirgula sp.]|uniref:DUF6111 family protein n=1 Tax=Methylovirgula sp. TaxID=1978224 RepID=UPI00307686D0
MWRVVLRPALLFLLPFMLYAIWLLLRRATPFGRHHWGSGVVSTLTLLGLVIAVIGMFAFGIFADRHLGAYVPAHIENGVVVPGRMQ